MAVRRESVRVDADVAPFVRGMVTAGASARKFANDLDSADSRMANIVQTGLALGPALVPIGAMAVPAVAGLTLQLGLAVGAAGAAIIAFQGIGDASKALSDYGLEPTAANFEKVQEAMNELGPAGQEFVLAMQEIRPEMQRMQDLAQQGLFPGVTEGIDELLVLMPQAEKLIFETSSALGNLVAEAGNNLNDPRWQEFFDYLTATAGPVLTEMGRTFGNFTEGIANMLMAFDPLSRDFSSWLLQNSRDFAAWSDALSDSASFQEFVSYIRESGPKVAETLSAIGGAFLDIIQALAPVGSVALPIIEAFADGLGAVADSSIGPALLGTAAAVGVLGRSMALLRTVGITGGGNGIVAQALGTEKMKASLPTLNQAGAYLYRMGQSADHASKKTLAARESMRGFGRAVAPAALAAGGFALATSGLAESTGLSNTASMALMGTLAGPWGAAVGGGVGLVMDLAAANNDLESALKSVNDQAATPLSIQKFAADVEGLSGSFEDATSTGHGFITDALMGLKSIGSDLDSKTRDSIHAANEELFLMRNALGTLFAEMNQGDLSMMSGSFAELEQYASQISPALEAAGVSWDEFIKAPSAAAPAIRAYVDEMDSASGRSRAVGDALAELENGMMGTASAASALGDSLDRLFGPALNQSAATDAWVRSLQDLKSQLRDTNGQLRGNSDAALANRDAIRSYVSATLDKVKADAAATGSGRQAAATLLQMRDSIISSAKAAGASEKNIRSLIQTMGLTPKNLETIVTTPGVLSAKEQVKALTKLYGLTPKQVATLMEQPGMERSQAEIKELASFYNITPKQVRTLLEAVDNASGKARALISVYAGIPRTITTSIVTNHIDKFIRQGGGVDKFASGGEVRGPGSATSDSIPAMLSDGEFVVRAAAVDHYGPNFFHMANAMKLASGGHVQRFASGGEARGERPHERALRRDLRDLRDEVRSSKEAMRDLRQQVKDSFNNDLFGSGASGVLLQLRADRNDAKQMSQELRQLRRKGLNGPLFDALAASGDLGTASEMSDMSRSRIRRFERAYAQRARAQRELAQAATGNGRQEIRALQKEIKGLSRRVERGAEKGTRAGMASRGRGTNQRRRAGR